MITYHDIQHNRREARLRRYNNLGHAAAMLAIVFAVFLAGCAPTQHSQSLARYEPMAGGYQGKPIGLGAGL